jgi:hypothetical protein
MKQNYTRYMKYSKYSTAKTLTFYHRRRQHCNWGGLKCFFQSFFLFKKKSRERKITFLLLYVHLKTYNIANHIHQYSEECWERPNNVVKFHLFVYWKKKFKK